MNKTHEISITEWSACKEYFKDSCAYCGLKQAEHFKKWKGELKNFDLHKEHVDHNGSNNLSNCIPACQNCNSQKWQFTLDEWYNETNINFNKERLVKIHKWLNEDNKLYKE